MEDLSSTHVLLLNKFNLVDRHVLVVTRTFEDQNEPLTLEDVSATWEVLKVSRKHSKMMIEVENSVCQMAELRFSIVDLILERASHTNTLKWVAFERRKTSDDYRSFRCRCPMKSLCR